MKAWIVLSIFLLSYKATAANFQLMSADEFDRAYSNYKPGSLQGLSVLQLTQFQRIYDSLGFESRRAMLIDRGRGPELVEAIVDLAALSNPPQLSLRGPSIEQNGEIILVSQILRYTLSPIDKFGQVIVLPPSSAIDSRGEVPLNERCDEVLVGSDDNE